MRFGESIGVDLVALSFVREPSDITEVRKHTRTPLIAKIEKPQAVQDAEEIIRAADCVMVARGDLGIELPIEDVPVVQKRLLAIAGELARPSITATQMLDSMVASSRPTRAEVTDVANAILDGTDAVMLSQETAVGAHPVEAVAMLASIAERTERELPYEHWNEHRVRRDARDPAYTVAHSACEAARELGLAALLVPTLSGRSARLISAHRPQVPIYALSPGRETVRRCGLIWGVEAGSMPRCEVTEQLIRDAAARGAGAGLGADAATASGSRPGFRAGGRGRRRCSRSRPYSDAVRGRRADANPDRGVMDGVARTKPTCGQPRLILGLSLWDSSCLVGTTCRWPAHDRSRQRRRALLPRYPVFRSLLRPSPRRPSPLQVRQCISADALRSSRIGMRAPPSAER